MAQGARFKQLVDDAKTRIREITPADAKQQQESGALLIDVREKDDYFQERAQGAKHVSRGVLELKIEELAPDPATPIICYCGGGSRSALAADNLQKMGYTNVASLTGGFKAWREQGLPTES
jgi:rhodanese-related sulfurtransferase